MDKLERKFAAILADNRRGAASITSAAGEVLIALCRRPDVTPELLLEYTVRLRQAHPSMAEIINLGEDLRECVADGMDRASLLVYLDAYQKETAAAMERAVAIVVRHFYDFHCVATLSRSRLVREVLAKTGARILIAESRPLNEGVDQAVMLSELGLKVSVVADALLPAILIEQKVDAAIVGCDALLPTGLVNKAGTYALALACHEANIFLATVLTSRRHLSAERAAFFAVSDHAVGEMNLPAKLAPKAINRYFDVTPLSLISIAYSEQGAFRPAERIMFR